MLKREMLEFLGTNPHSMLLFLRLFTIEITLRGTFLGALSSVVIQTSLTKLLNLFNKYFFRKSPFPH